MINVCCLLFGVCGLAFGVESSKLNEIKSSMEHPDTYPLREDVF
jgi:hypothetical protein